MSKKNILIFCVLFLFCIYFMGCTDSFNINSHTDININLDLNKIIKATRNDNNINNNNSSSFSSEYLLKVSLYDAKNFDEISRTCPKDSLICEEQIQLNNGTANIKFDNVTIGSNVIIFADLYEISNLDGESSNNLKLIYSGDSSVFTVNQYNNKINIVLKKVQIDDIVPNPDFGENPDDNPDIGENPDDNPDIGENPDVNENPDDVPDVDDIPEVEPKLPTILLQPDNILKVFANEGEATEIKNAQLSCSAFVSDGGTLSFDWYLVDSENNISLIENDTETTNDLEKTSTISVDVKVGETKTFYCVISNTLDDKVVTVNSNLATVACVIGNLDSFTAKYTGDYEVYGKDYNEIRKNIEITEYYKDEFDNVAILTFQNPSEDKFTIDINSGYESYIGYVPFSITENTLKKQQEIIVPVKYQLDADMFNYEFVYTEDETILFDSTDNVLVPQYFTNLSYEYLGEVVPTNVREQNGEVSEFDIDDNLVMILNSKNGNNFDTAGTSVYTVTISSNASFAWILGAAIKDFNVQVCPWQIIIKDSTVSDVSPSQITFDTTYSLNLFNDALQENTNLPDITFDGDGVSGTEFTLPESGSSTIFAKCNEKQIATIEVKPVLVGINVSFPTYSDIDGLTYTTNGSIVTFSVADNYSSYEWFIDFEKQYNSSFIYSLNTEYMAGGIYSIMLIVTDESGNTYSAEYQLEIRK